MRDPARIRQMCALLEQVWSQVPDQRLGQLIENIVPLHTAQGDLYYLEDDEFLGALLRTKRLRGLS